MHAILVVAAQVFDACVAAGRRAAEPAPDDGHLHGILGQFLYKAEHLDDARAALERAIELGHRGWPDLWLAYTLHDQERWAEAADAYKRVPPAELPAHASWRVQLARQQRASCLLRAGQREEALAAYSEVLARFERALDADLDSTSSPVLEVGPPNYLFGDIESLPELEDQASKLRARLDKHADPVLHTS